MISVRGDILSATYKLGGFEFFKIKEYPNASRYRILRRLATLKVCGRWYVAFHALNISAENPIVTVKVP
jgi:hypothetical protein